MPEGRAGMRRAIGSTMGAKARVVGAGAGYLRCVIMGGCDGVDECVYRGHCGIFVLGVGSGTERVPT